MATEIPTDSAPQNAPIPSGGLREHTLRKLVPGALGGLLVVLFLLWPYQQWDFGRRFSLIHGWAKWVSRSADWQFCLLVPFLVGWLVWLRRDELRRLPWRGDWLGLLPLGLGMFFFWIGYKADTGYPGFLAVQFVLAGLILLVAGRAWMRSLFFAWLFLFFTWPMQPLEDSVASPLRPRTAAMAAGVLNVIGVPALNDGSALQSAPDAASGLEIGSRFNLDVDANCSGINSLFALMMISALLGYLALKQPWMRLVLFACAVPLAVAGNVVRLLLLVAGTLKFGSEFAVGRRMGEHQEMSGYHTFAGFAVFGVALAGMFAVCWLLEGREIRRNLKRQGTATGGHDTVFSIPLPRRTLAQLLAAVLVPLAALGICAGTDVSFHLAHPGVMLKLPLTVDGYQGRELGMTAKEKDKLEEGVRLARNGYASPAGHEFMVTVILSGMVKRSLHRPEVCLPGQGWTISSSNQIPLQLDDGREITVTMLRIFRDTEPQPGVHMRTRAVNLYWYVGSNGVTCADHYEHILRTYYDATFRNIHHRWAMASIYIPMPEQHAGREDPFLELGAVEDARALIGKLAPYFMPKNSDQIIGSNLPASAP